VVDCAKFRAGEKPEIDRLAQFSAKSWLSNQAHQLRKREEDLRISLVLGSSPGTTVTTRFQQRFLWPES
jgi:hypothetical protein